MAEETQNAAVNAPRGIVMTCGAAAVVGGLYVIGLLYAMGGNVDAALNGQSD